MKKILFILALILCPLSVMGQTGAIQGTSTLGGISATTQGAQSSNKLLGVIPAAKISIYLTGTQTLATLTSDGTHSLSNPFYSNASNAVNPGGYIAFVSTNIGYDVVASSGQGTPNCTTGPMCYTQPVTLCKDCFASSQFIAPGVVSITGANGPIACTGGSCNIAGQSAVLQHNGTNLPSQTLLNFLDAAPSLPAGYTPVTFSSNGSGGLGGYIPPTSAGSGLTMAVAAPISGQYVIIHPTAFTLSATMGPASVANNNSALAIWECVGVTCNLTPNTVVTWSGFALPAGVSAGSVTAVYAYSINGAQPPLGVTVANAIGSTFTCGSVGVKPGLSTWEIQQTTNITSATGSTIGSVTCTDTLIAGGAPGPSGLTMNVADVGLIVYYTGTPVVAPNTTYVAPSLYYNSSLSTLGVDTTGLAGLSGMTAGQVPLAATATTVTSSKALAGSGTGITTGPTTSTNLDCARFSGTTGQIADAGAPCGSGGSLSLTTIGSSGAATLSGGVLNVPIYSGGGSGAWTNITGSVTVSGCTVSSGSCAVSGTGTGTVTLSSIPGSYNRLQLVVFGDTISASTNLTMQFNGDSSAHYSTSGYYQIGTAGTPQQNTQASGSSCIVGSFANGLVSSTIIDIPFYQSTTYGKIEIHHSIGLNAINSTTANIDVGGSCGWQATSPVAITSITFSPASGNFSNGTQFMILGQN